MSAKFFIELVRPNARLQADKFPRLERIPVAYDSVADAMEDGRRLIRDRKLRARSFRIVDQDGKLVCENTDFSR